MPAVEKLMPTPGISMIWEPATMSTVHSLSCIAFKPLWHAASEAEHAVSKVTHGPFNPRTYDSRPEAIDAVDPVAAYTLPPALPSRRIWANSQRSSSIRWHGSIAEHSEGEILNAALSASCAPCTKPVWRARLAMSAGRRAVAASASHRDSGISEITSRPQSTRS
eukprot:2274857-Prymnesium_polylepis.2